VPLPKSGAQPFQEAKTLKPTTEAIKDGRRASYSKSRRYRISMLKIAPPNGDLKMEPMPAPTPAATAMRRSEEER